MELTAAATLRTPDLCALLARTPTSHRCDGQLHATATVGTLCDRQNSTFRPSQLHRLVVWPRRPGQGGAERGQHDSRCGCRRLVFKVSMTVVGLIPSTRAVSRIPLPFKAISTICCLTTCRKPLCVY